MIETQRRRGRPSGMTGDALLAVAREIFLERGYTRTSMDEVAARAEISKASLYREHPSKGILYAAVVSEWAAAGRDAMRPAVCRLVDNPGIREGLLDFAQTLCDSVLSTDVLRMRRLVLSEAEHHPDVAAAYLSDSWNRNIDALAGGLTTLVDHGRLNISDPGRAADQFTWLILGAPLNAQLLTGGSSALVDRRTLSAAVDLFITGYRP